MSIFAKSSVGQDFEVLASMASSLTEQAVINARLGLNSTAGRQTLESIGEDMNLTRERIRQIEGDVIQRYCSLFPSIWMQTPPTGLAKFNKLAWDLAPIKAADLERRATKEGLISDGHPGVRVIFHVVSLIAGGRGNVPVCAKAADGESLVCREPDSDVESYRLTMAEAHRLSRTHGFFTLASISDAPGNKSRIRRVIRGSSEIWRGIHNGSSIFATNNQRNLFFDVLAKQASVTGGCVKMSDIIAGARFITRDRRTDDAAMNPQLVADLFRSRPDLCAITKQNVTFLKPSPVDQVLGRNFAALIEAAKKAATEAGSAVVSRRAIATELPVSMNQTSVLAILYKTPAIIPQGNGLWRIVQ